MRKAYVEQIWCTGSTDLVGGREAVVIGSRLDLYDWLLLCFLLIPPSLSSSASPPSPSSPSLPGSNFSLKPLRT